MRKNVVNRVLLGLIGIGTLLLSACSSEQPAVNQGIWTYQPDAITLNYSAPHNLNTSDGQSHVLLLVAVQTAELQNVQSYLQNPQGLSLLLGKTNEPGQAQNYYLTKFFVNPGESREVKITRMAGMQHVVIIAGYNQLNPDQVTKIFNIPVKRKFFWGAHYPAIMQINLMLGEQGITKATYVKK